MKAAGDASAFQGLLRTVLLTQGHESGHFVLGEADLVPAQFCEGEVFDLELEAGLGNGRGDGLGGLYGCHVRVWKGVVVKRRMKTS